MGFNSGFKGLKTQNIQDAGSALVFSWYGEMEEPSLAACYKELF